MLTKLKLKPEFSFNILTLMTDDRIEQLESNNYKSKTRNKLIALMFKECGLIEKYGFGIGCIKKFCKANKIAEKFDKVIQRTVERWIKQLKDEGKIEFIGVSKTGGYCVK